MFQLLALPPEILKRISVSELEVSSRLYLGCKAFSDAHKERLGAMFDEVVRRLVHECDARWTINIASLRLDMKRPAFGFSGTRVISVKVDRHPVRIWYGEKVVTRNDNCTDRVTWKFFPVDETSGTGDAVITRGHFMYKGTIGEYIVANSKLLYDLPVEEQYDLSDEEN